MIRLLMHSITASLLFLSLVSSAGAEEPLTVVEVRSLFNDGLFDMAYTVHIAKEHYDEALKVAEQAIKGKPSELAWRRKAASAAESAGRQETALIHWLYLAQMGDGTARQSALRLSRSMHEYQVRRYLLEELLLAGDADPELLREYVKVSEELGMVRDAYNLLSSGLPSFSNRELLLKEQARLAELLTRPEDAVNALNKLALIRPLTPDETTQRAQYMFGQGDLKQSWQAASILEADNDAAAASEPRSSFVWNRAAERRRAERRFFQIEPPSVGAQLKYELDQNVHTASGQKNTDSSQTATERLELATKGFVYHPALLQFNLKFLPEFQQVLQTRTDSTGKKDANGNSFNANYQANAVILSQKPYTLTLFAHSLETRSWAAYTGASKNSTDSYGADLALKYSLFPTTVGFSSSSASQSSYFGSSNEWQEAHLLSRHRGISGDSSITSTYSENKQVTNNVANKIKTLNSTFNNQYKVTDDSRINLASNLQYMDQNSETYQNKSLSLFENLSWQHLQNLRSRYSLNYRQLDTGITDGSWTTLNGSLTHKLYENLTTTAGITGATNSYGDSREKAVATLINTAYQRTLGNWGALNLNAGLNYRYTTRTGAPEDTQVINEPHTLSSMTETYLDRSGIDTASIVVTNSDGTIIYVADVDYRIDSIGSSVRISRLPLGVITDGQLISVNYSYTSDAAYDDTLLAQNYGVALELKRSLFLTYRYMNTKQTLLAGPQPERLSNAATHLTTIRYDAGWSESGATYEDNNSSSDISYRRWELGQTLRLRLSNRFHHTLRGYYGETVYRSYAERKKISGATTILNWMPSNLMRFEVEGYLEQVDATLEKTVNGGVRSGLELNYRLWTTKLGYKLAVQENSLSDSRRTNQQLQLELRRTMW